MSLHLRSSCVVLFATVIPTVAGCHSRGTAPEPSIAEPGIQEQDSLSFEITSLPGEHGQTAFLGTYTADGRTARFRVVLRAPTGSDSPNSTSRVLFGKGSFQSDPSSDASTLTRDLQRTLQAKGIPKNVSRVSSLDFTYAILGQNQSLRPDGGFTDHPQGDWTAMKVFLPTGEEDAEVFLNFNQKLRRGQFSLKDPDYGDAVVAKLASVL